MSLLFAIPKHENLDVAESLFCGAAHLRIIKMFLNERNDYRQIETAMDSRNVSQAKKGCVVDVVIIDSERFEEYVLEPSRIVNRERRPYQAGGQFLVPGIQHSPDFTFFDRSWFFVSHCSLHSPKNDRIVDHGDGCES